MLRRKDLTKRAVKKKAQSTVEYIVIIAAVIAAVLIFAPTLGTTLASVFGVAKNQMLNMSNRLSTAYPGNWGNSI